MKAILQRWNVMRILRLVLGIVILVQGIVSKDAITIMLGVVLVGMAVANIGCCRTNGCAITTTSNGKTKKIDYEELDLKK